MSNCWRTECSTTAGCKHRGPNGEFCYFPPPRFGSLSEFTDDEIAREYHVRAAAKLGDPRVGVTFSSIKHRAPQAGAPMGFRRLPRFLDAATATHSHISDEWTWA